MLRATVTSALVLVCATAAAQEGYGDYHALVIGNDDYQHVEKLKTAVADAEAVAKLLKEHYEFEVTVLKNGTRAQIVSALGSYRRSLTKSDNLLVYYAGHGYLDRDVEEGYWFPVDARKDDEAQWISNATITTRLKAVPAKHVMVVSDSCYSGSLTRGLTVKVRGAAQFAALAAKRARVVLTSGGLEPVEDAGGGGHSIFARSFLDALEANDGVLDGAGLYEQIKPKVLLGADQKPDYGNIRKCGHEGGDFLFVRTNRAAKAAAEAEAAEARRRAAESDLGDAERDAAENQREADELRRKLAAMEAEKAAKERQARARAESERAAREAAELRRKLEAESGPPKFPGFSFLREETFSGGGKQHTLKVYRCNAFAKALGSGDTPACEFVLIPGGSFTMGSPEDEFERSEHEGPQRVVSVRPFLMARTEVTQRVWQRLGGRGKPARFKETRGGDRLPVEASWHKVQLFLRTCGVAGLRLPSEAE
jgi:uncharacterized caspase-like protein